MLQIELGFLMVGHTHEDIDQSFSCVSRYLRKHNALTIPGKFIDLNNHCYTTCSMLLYVFSALEAACKAANHTTRKTMTLHYIVDFKKWLAPHIEEVHGHTNPHIFLFKKNASGKSVMYYKNWTHDDYQPKDGVKLLKARI